MKFQSKSKKNKTHFFQTQFSNIFERTVSALSTNPQSSSSNKTQIVAAPDIPLDDGLSSSTRKRFGVPYSKPITDLLTHWLLTHAHHPYPTEEEKLELCRQTQLSLNQLNNWFTNARRRNKIQEFVWKKVKKSVKKVKKSEKSEKKWKKYEKIERTVFTKLLFYSSQHTLKQKEDFDFLNVFWKRL